MKRAFAWSLVAGVAGSIAWGAEGQQESKNQGFKNEEPWEWFIEPVEVQLEALPQVANESEESKERVQPMFLVNLPNNKIASQIQIIQKVLPLVVCGAADDPELRLVAFDENKQRLENYGGGSVTTPYAQVHSNSMKLGDKKLKFIGVEYLTPEKQKLQAQKAYEELAKEGTLLPYPVEGEAFSYQLSQENGRAIKASDHLGKVVLIQWWATW